MQHQRVQKRIKFIVYMMILMVLGGVLIFFEPYYLLNDDVMIKSILSGKYTGMPDGHAVYMKYPLTGLISMLYRIIDRIPWFDLVMVGCVWLAISAVICRVVDMRPEKDKNRYLVGVVSVLCLALFVPPLLTAHYTLTAAIVGSCALFLSMTGGGWLWVVLLAMCYCIRSQIFLVLLPFLAICLLWRMIDLRGNGQKSGRLMVESGVLAGSVLLCVFWNGCMYYSEDWQEYLDYNASRTRLYDYEKLLPYEENIQLFEEAGISDMEYSLLEEYALVLDGTIQKEIMDKASELTIQRKDEQRSGIERLEYCIREYYYHLRYIDVPYNVLCIGMYLVVFVMILRKRDVLRALLVAGMAGGRSLIWIYLIWRGRFPERIYISLYLLELMILAAMLVLLICGNSRDGKGYVPAILGGVFSVVLVIVGVYQSSLMLERIEKQQKQQAYWEMVEEYCTSHEKMFYLLDVYSMVNYTGKMWSNDSEQVNYLLAGGWMSGTPLLAERLGEFEDGGEMMGTPNLEEGECCYIAAADRDISWLYKYFEQRFKDLSLEKVDIIYAGGQEMFAVYCLE